MEVRNFQPMRSNLGSDSGAVRIQTDQGVVDLEPTPLSNQQPKQFHDHLQLVSNQKHQTSYSQQQYVAITVVILDVDLSGQRWTSASRLEKAMLISE
jgi:hypothetical protein